MAFALGNLVGAWEVFDDCLAIAQQLAVRLPEDASSLRQQVLAHERISEVAQQAGSPAAAERSFTAALAATERLALVHRPVGGSGFTPADQRGIDEQLVGRSGTGQRLAELDPSGSIGLGVKLSIGRGFAWHRTVAREQRSRLIDALGGSTDVDVIPARSGSRRVLISTASGNAAIADRLGRFWAGLGVEVSHFGVRDRQGSPSLEEIKRKIAQADIFVALVSPQYLDSPWCRLECDFALQHEINTGSEFISVVMVGDISSAEAGLLGSYDWVVATGELTDERLNAISARLPLGSTAAAAAAEAVATVTTPGFRNRYDELANLRSALLTTGGRDLWVVVAPPLMGKSWLLARLEQALAGADPHWTVRHLDLRHEPTELRTNPTRLVASLLDVDMVSQQVPLLDDDLRDIAAQVSIRKGPQLFVLDSADLLTPACAASARAALTAVRRLVRLMAWDGRFALVIGTRRHDEWRGLGVDARTGERLQALRLTEFGHETLHQALLDLPLDFGREERWRYAERLHRLTEGLPALLVKSVQWAQDTAFRQMHWSNDPLAFDAVARDYIENELLSPESLLPLGSARPAETLVVLREMLRVLSTYRLYTPSHLKFYLDADPGLRQALADAHWTRGDLWDALGQTALGAQQDAPEIWQEIDPPIRRLLYRHHHRTDGDRIAAHSMARRFYGGWTQDRAAGREQQVVLVESLWHEASRLAIEQPGALARLLPGIAVELAETLGSSPMYEPTEFDDAVVRRLRDDEELTMLLSGHEGLFAEIVKSVSLTIGGGR